MGVVGMSSSTGHTTVTVNRSLVRILIGIVLIGIAASFGGTIGTVGLILGAFTVGFWASVATYESPTEIDEGGDTDE
jgi:hypothetical protein